MIVQALRVVGVCFLGDRFAVTLKMMGQPGLGREDGSGFGGSCDSLPGSTLRLRKTNGHHILLSYLRAFHCRHNSGFSHGFGSISHLPSGRPSENPEFCCFSWPLKTDLYVYIYYNNTLLYIYIL